jgi:hypothetical protein
MLAGAAAMRLPASDYNYSKEIQTTACALLKWPVTLPNWQSFAPV